MTRKAIKRTLLLALLFLLLIPGTQALAASKKMKAMKAYSKYLAAHVADPSYEKYYDDASYSPENMDYVSSFFLYDINKDKVPELFAFTTVNFRWFNVRIFTYNNGNVKLYKIKGVGDAEFTDRATANGSYSFYICSKKHIHNMWGGSTPMGYDASYETVYKPSKGKLKVYLSKDDKFTGMSSTYKKYGKEITAEKYASLTSGCSAKKIKSYENTAKNRKKLKKGKLKVN